MSTTYGGIFYAEYKSLTKVSAGMFAVGVIMVIVGIAVLAFVSDEEDHGPLTDGVRNSAKVAPVPEAEAGEANDEIAGGATQPMPTLQGDENQDSSRVATEA